MSKRMPLKGVCSIDGCNRAVAALRRCKNHRREMSADEVRVAHLEANQRKSIAKMGERNPQYGKTRESSARWIGDDVGYHGVHSWMSTHYGQPKHCEQCGTSDPDKRYEWANISGEYHRDRADFKRLCKACHNNHDANNAYQVGAPPRKNRAMSVWNGKPPSSPYKGVRASGYGTWLASLTVKGQRVNLGSFKTQANAARAYNAAVIEAHGDDAFLNEIQDECA